MQFVKPMLFQEAVDKLGARSLIGSQISSSEWSDVPLALRERAFFSSTIESLRFLQRARDSIGDFLSNARETLENGEVVLKTGGRAQFVKEMSAWAIGEGMGPLDPELAGSIKDITSEKRLGLVFDVQVRQAQDFGYWKQGMDPSVLNEFPAQRFIREIDVKEPRQSHHQYENEVRLKSDLAFWIGINQDFGVPWGPWGWGCGHGVEDVDRDESEKLGLIGPGESPSSVEKDFNDRLEASVKNLDPDLVTMLQESFGDQIEIQGDTAIWREQLRPEIEVTVLPDGAPIPTSPQPLSPSGEGNQTAPRPTLQDVLGQAGIGSGPVKGSDMTRFLSELQEDKPTELNSVVRTVTVPRYANFTAAEVRSAAQEFVNYLPPSLVSRLPKLDLRVETLKAKGNYTAGGIVRINSDLDAKEMRQVMIHELTHWVHQEGSAAFKEAITKHFEERTKGEKIAKLPGYRARGKKDDWYEAYAGRVYGWETKDFGLEVPTRYAEWLTMDPETMAELWNTPSFQETMKIVLEAFF